MTGASEEVIRKRLLQCGVTHPLVLDGQWLSDTIAANRSLRMFVPRVYGLGDLSQILDDRAYSQALALLESSREQIATFVVTSTYRKAAQALNDHGFVLLLGEPAVGKSSIALMLALGAADNWQCASIKARSSEELVQRWNPHEKGQFFWVDDAFGAVRHERHLTDKWARDLPFVMHAIKSGARVVLTSRSYIYNEARPFLKAYAYPLLHEQQVSVDVADITKEERKQIVYNHIAAGDQTPQAISRMKPHLEAAANVEPFRPEAARRLGLTAFTRNLRLSRSSIESFISCPHRFLSDLYSQLDAASQAALALVYISPDGLLAPLALDATHRDVIELVGGTVADAGRALTSLAGTFLQHSVEKSGKTSWSFKHPTLREGFAAWLIDQPHLLSVILAGMDDTTLLDQTHCLPAGDDQGDGVLLRIPTALYHDVAVRLANLFEAWPGGSCWTGDATSYLGEKCSDQMLSIFLTVYPSLPSRLMDFFSSVSLAPEPLLLARLHKKGALPELYRHRAIEQMNRLAVDELETGWLTDAPWQQLLTKRDRERLIRLVQSSLVPYLEEIVQEDPTSGWGYSAQSKDPLGHALLVYYRVFEDLGEMATARKFKSAIELHLGACPVTVSDDQEILFSSAGEYKQNIDSSRSVFSDLE
ncbi:nSTAND3 domain-containing NTPase [Streptomyces liliifuscus]|uniref:Novel STAND NTPase 3 domain-containing protein n=1 Tax=Streptomyces liliifuscus TaxID=2797636 RepID=A0A7T7I564_9ACTN|nr:hypothetical protein [Streptomyces liliifuscus]QQM41141.1 hypothetical protein JEQ17_17775 [Streptomyces liliifuscus]